jgi:hypothetical protein
MKTIELQEKAFLDMFNAVDCQTALARKQRGEKTVHEAVEDWEKIRELDEFINSFN